MKPLLLILFLLMLTGQPSAQLYQQVHRKATLVDTHNDVLSSAVLEGKDISKRLATGHSDFERWKEGGVNVQFFSVWTDKNARNKTGFYADANQEIDSLERIVLRNHQRLALALRYKDIRRGIRQNKLVAMIGVEGGHMIEDDLGKLDALARRGMRYLTLTWNNSTSWATSAMDETSTDPAVLAGRSKGLTDFGRQVVRRLNELGVMVDLSHTGEQTFYDALAITKKPVILSHSSVWTLCPVFRNVKDDQIKAVAQNNGVICINFYSGFVSAAYDKRSTWLNGAGKKGIQDSLLRVCQGDSAAMQKAWNSYYDQAMDAVRPSISELVDHIDYIVKLVGDDYVGLGADYDGVSSVPRGLEDVSKYPAITHELMRRGYSNRSIRKILGGNVLRVMRANFSK